MGAGFIRDLESRREDNFDFKEFSIAASSIGLSAPPNPHLSNRHQTHARRRGQNAYTTSTATSRVGGQSGAPLGLRLDSGSPSTIRVQEAAPIVERRAWQIPTNVLHSNTMIPDLITSEIHPDHQQVLSHRPQAPRVPPDLCRSLIVQLADRQQRVQVSDLLGYFWDKSVYSNCLICDGDFKELEPPIRTISLEQTHTLEESFDPPFTSLIIRIHDRHLDCLKIAKTAFIPVSHVWHQSIAEACVSRAISAAATECLYNVIARILPAVTTKFKSLYRRVELWYDYVSIPQWHREAQQSLSLMLPDIFRIAPLCLVHLDDVPASTIAAAAQFDDTTAQHDQYAKLAAFYRSKWFERMWVSLEYAYCSQACVYTMDVVILCANREMMCDSFSFLLEEFQQQIGRIVINVGGKKFQDLFAQVPTPILGPWEICDAT